MKYEEFQAHEEVVFDYLLKKYKWHICTTPRYAMVDGFATMNNEVTHIIEFKSRNESHRSLMNYGTYLISYDKIAAGMMISEHMDVPFILIVYCVRDKTILGIEIGNPEGVSAPMIIKETYTQQTSDGGRVKRRNAFIDMDNFHIL